MEMDRVCATELAIGCFNELSRCVDRLKFAGFIFDMPIPDTIEVGGHVIKRNECFDD
jgi:hypothetical protein